jgi:hypothetical protein
MKQLANPLSHQRTVAKWLVITQQKTLGKSLVIAIRLGYQKALHSHLTDETTSHSTRLSKNDNQVAGYKLANYAN